MMPSSRPTCLCFQEPERQADARVDVLAGACTQVFCTMQGHLGLCTDTTEHCAGAVLFGLLVTAEFQSAGLTEMPPTAEGIARITASLGRLDRIVAAARERGAVVIARMEAEASGGALNS